MRPNYLLLILGFPLMLGFGCQRNVDELALSDESPARSNRANETMARAQLRNYDASGQSFHYLTRTQGDPRAIDPTLMLHIAAKLNQAAFKVPWRELDQMTKTFITERGIDPLGDDTRYDASLQLAAFETAHRAGLREAPSPERDAMLTYYMDVLVAQKAVDCDALAELLLELRSIVSQERFVTYYNYVLTTARSEFAYSEEKLHQLREQLDQGLLPAAEKNAFLAEVAKYRAQRLGAEQALSLLEGFAE